MKGLKKYGMFVADNGIDWAISVAPDPRIPEPPRRTAPSQGLGFRSRRTAAGGNAKEGANLMVAESSPMLRCARRMDGFGPGIACRRSTRAIDYMHGKVNLQKDGNKAKPYQVRQIRSLILQHRLGDNP